MQAGSSKIGFIGLGIMGTPMCGHLIAAGHELFVRARGQLPPAIAATSATPCVSNRAVAQQAEVVFGLGGQGWDHSALVRALEQLANFEIGRQVGA